MKICPNCDLVLDVPDINGKFVGVCPRCGCVIKRYHQAPVIYSFCYAIAAIIFLVASIYLPFLSISSAGIIQTIKVLDYMFVFISDGMWPATILVYMFMQFFPLLVLLIIIYADYCVLVNVKRKVVVKLMHIYHLCSEWSMVEVFVIGVLVSLIKLIALVDVSYGAGFWCFILFSIMYILAVKRFDFDFIWDYFIPQKIDTVNRNFVSGIRATMQGFYSCKCCGTPVDIKKYSVCPRCGCVIKDSSKYATQRCLALVISAVIMYVPANVYPMMITTYMGVDTSSTILDGVISLWQMHSYFVSGVIFVASICIPVLKILALLFLCFSLRKYKHTKKRKSLNVLYRIVEFIGKWSMIDVFVVAIMASIVRIKGIMVIYPGTALMSFAIVVILTMLAARSFDPKLIWNK